MIPIIGPIIGAVPAILVALAEDPMKALWVALAFLIIQQVENNFIVPKIQGDFLRMHPGVIIVLLVVAGSVGGLIMIITIVPLAAFVRDLYQYLYLRVGNVPADEALDRSLGEYGALALRTRWKLEEIVPAANLAPGLQPRIPARCGRAPTIRGRDARRIGLLSREDTHGHIDAATAARGRARHRPSADRDPPRHPPARELSTEEHRTQASSSTACARSGSMTCGPPRHRRHRHRARSRPGPALLWRADIDGLPLMRKLGCRSPRRRKRCTPADTTATRHRAALRLRRARPSRQRASRLPPARAAAALTADQGGHPRIAARRPGRPATSGAGAGRQVLVRPGAISPR
jgi:hypothetical protein